MPRLAAAGARLDETAAEGAAAVAEVRKGLAGATTQLEAAVAAAWSAAALSAAFVSASRLAKSLWITL